MRLNYDKATLITALREKFGDVVTRKQVLSHVTTSGIEIPHWLFNNKSFRAGRGSYDLSKVPVKQTNSTTATNTSASV